MDYDAVATTYEPLEPWYEHLYGVLHTLVRAELAGNKLLVSVNDDGTGLRPNIRSNGLGIGLPLIARVSESYRIEDGHDSGAVITMSFLTKRATL